MLVLFGSAATGAKKPEDIDVAVFLADVAREGILASLEKQCEITATAADFLGDPADKLDAVFMHRGIAPLLAYHIARDGKLLFGAEEGFMRFRVRAVKMYYDSEKFFELRRQYLQRVYA